MPFRIPALLAALLTAATAVAVPAHADSVDDTFLNTLDHLGLPYDDPAAAVDLGQSVCPSLQKPGADAASTAAKIAGRDGIQAALAGLFTSIAISTYCPRAFTAVTDPSTPDLSLLRDVPGLQFVPVG